MLTIREYVYFAMLVPFLLLCPSPWPDYLGIQTWPRYSEGVYYLHTTNDISRSRLSKVQKHEQGRQKDRKTDATERITI